MKELCTLSLKSKEANLIQVLRSISLNSARILIWHQRRTRALYLEKVLQ